MSVGLRFEYPIGLVRCHIDAHYWRTPDIHPTDYGTPIHAWKGSWKDVVLWHCIWLSACALLPSRQRRFGFDLHTVWRSVSDELLKSEKRAGRCLCFVVLFLFLLALSIPHRIMFVKLWQLYKMGWKMGVKRVMCSAVWWNCPYYPKKFQTGGIL